MEERQKGDSSKCCRCHRDGNEEHENKISDAAAAVSTATRHITFTSENQRALSTLSRSASGDFQHISSTLTSPSTSAVANLALETRIEELEEKLDKSLSVNVQLQQQLIRLEMRQAQSDGSNDELYKRLGILLTTTGTLSERMKSLETTTFSALKGEIAQLRSDYEDRDTDVSRLFTNFKEQLTRVSDGAKTSLEENKRMFEDNLKAVPQRPSTEELSRNIEAEVQRLVSIILDDFQRAQSTALHDMGKRLDQEMDKRHRRLVDSTHQAVTEAAKGYETTAPQIRTLQNDLLQIREQMRVQSVQIESQRTDTSFEVAINEMKDWIQDIERKLISRTEVEEVVLQLSSQVSSLKHSSQSNEAVLSQKLEVEKSARESAVSQLASQLLMSGRKR